MADEFKRRYAVRMPNGELYRQPVAQQQVEDYSMSSPMRDYMSMMGLVSTPPKPTAPQGPAIFDNRKGAEDLLTDLQAMAYRVGVELWGGVVVEQLCTPFTSGDPSVEFAEAVVAWLNEQRGGKS